MLSPISKGLFIAGLFFLIQVFVPVTAFSQLNPDSILAKLDPLTFAASVKQHSQKLEERLTKKSDRALDKLQKQEEKIYRKLLSSKDSLEAKKQLGDIKEKYAAQKTRLKNPLSTTAGSHYLPKLDSANTALKFLGENGYADQVKSALGKTELLKSRFNQAEEIKKFIAERKKQLRSRLENLGLTKQLKRINKQAYYYSAQLKEYREMLKDPKKIKRKALELLGKTKAFQNFFKKHSELASLFRMPGDPNDPAYLASLSGLQTRAQIGSMIQSQIASVGAGGQEQFQNQMQAAQSQLNELKNKFLKQSSGGGGSSDDIMPEGFRPNSQKTKSFFQRLELGVNVQTQKSTNLFPVRSDIGLSAGYRINDRSMVGVGMSYSLGLGRGWQHIKVSHQGMGLRSFVDVKLKGSFWMSGGYEMNFRSEIKNIEQLKDYSAWTRSGLLGVSKVVSVRSKFFKKTKIQALWDFLSYRQQPVQNPFVFRIGYNIN